jgi:hypothetical protein
MSTPENGYRIYQGLTGIAIDVIVRGLVYQLEPDDRVRSLPFGYYDFDFNFIQQDEPGRPDK